MRQCNWFAWYPVKCWPIGRWIWLRRVHRTINEFGQTCYEEIWQ